MAQFRRSAAGLGYKGIPALVFIGLNNYGVGTQLHIEKLTNLDKIYSALRGYLPIVIDRNEFNEIFAAMLKDADNRLQSAYENYDPMYEDVETCNPEEKNFIIEVRAIYILLMEITAKSKIIDDQKPQDEEVNF
jgi:hypothetical protein